MGAAGTDRASGDTMNFERLTPHLPRITWVLIALLLLLTGWNTWRLVQVVRQARAEAAQALAQANGTPPPLDAAQAWQRMLAANLFGTPAQGEAPPTTLPLHLEGVWADASGTGYAMIAADKAPAKVYAAGEAMPYGATLRRVFPDRVLLDTAAGLQSLALVKHENGAGGDSTAAELAIDQPLPAQLAGPRREAAAQDAPPMRGPKPMVWPDGHQPLRYGESVIGVPMLQDGRISGYELRPGSDTEAFSRLGLRPGDVLVGIDGQPVGDPAQSTALLQQAIQSGHGRIQIERRGQSMTLDTNPQ